MAQNGPGYEKLAVHQLLSELSNGAAYNELDRLNAAREAADLQTAIAMLMGMLPESDGRQSFPSYSRRGRGRDDRRSDSGPSRSSSAPYRPQIGCPLHQSSSHNAVSRGTLECSGRNLPSGKAERAFQALKELQHKGKHLSPHMVTAEMKKAGSGEAPGSAGPASQQKKWYGLRPAVPETPTAEVLTLASARADGPQATTSMKRRRDEPPRSAANELPIVPAITADPASCAFAVSVGDLLGVAQIDTGSDINVISRGFMTRVGLKCTRDEHGIRARSFNGQYLKLDLKCDFAIRVGDYTRRISAFVADMHSVQIILGKPWIGEHHVVINLHDRSFTVRATGSEVTHEWYSYSAVATRKARESLEKI
nr:hypothetical protein HK105_001099 [Polyrhizophydium stewartii]